MKKYLFFALMAVAAIVFTSCKKDDDSPQKPKDVSWTDEQWNTIKTLRKVDDGGYLYEINYTADYRLDEVLKLNGAYLVDAINNIKNVILPNSQWTFPFDLSTISTGLGCSCFSAKSGNGYVLGRNYDFPPIDDHSMIVHTPQVKDADGNIIRHATVGCADLAPITNLMGVSRGYEDDKMKEFSLYSPYFILDGINDAGLMCGLMILEYDGTFQEDPAKLNLLNVMIPRLILDKCTKVSEAVAMIEDYKVQTMFAIADPEHCIDMHFVIADNYGDRVVVEWVNNNIRVLRPGVDGELAEQSSDDYVLATNFYLASDAAECPEDVNELGFWRYETLNDLLYANSNPTAEEAMDMCKAVKIMQNDPEAVNAMEIMDPTHAHWNDKDSWPWITLWSEVYDTKTLSMIFCSREEYGKPYTISLEY